LQSDCHQQRLTILNFRLARTQAYLAHLNRREARYPWLRLASVLAALLGGFVAAQLLIPLLAALVTFVLLSIFVLITIAHRRVIAAAARMAVLERLLAAQAGRAALEWQRIPPHHPLPVPPEHPFDRDLLVTGPCSLHQLIDIAASTGGSRRLADWLLTPLPNTEKIAQRQQWVRELAQLPGLRTRLMLEGELVRAEAAARTAPGTDTAASRWNTDAILGWVKSRTSAEALRPVLIVLGVLAAANISLFLLNALGSLPALWIATFLVYFGLQSARTRESSEVFNEAYALALGVGQFRRVMSDLERYPYTPGSGLARLCAPFWKGPELPSAMLRQISLIASAASLRTNPALGLLLNILVPWDLFFAYLLERVKRHMRALLPLWLDAYYEVEAVHSLANYASLNPEAVFPVILDGAPGQPIFETHQLAHPLIAPAPRVSNDFSLRQLGQVDLITGSNMSGKSTFLRTIGANLCLAYAGGVVCAANLRVLPFRLYTSMNVSDSLTDGISFFYAEVRRLKTLLDQLSPGHPLPLFFLIDEIFRGTNNRERRIGSESYVRALAGAPGAGLISTHDLELVHLADEIPQVQNYHFREDIVDGKMVFDYRLRAGPSPTTNALRIMALAGLPVNT
jgi:hypothetical protein